MNFFELCVHFLLPVRQIENYTTTSGDVPTAPIVIADCGVLSPEELAQLSTTKSDKVDPYEDYPTDEDRNTENPEVALQIAKDVREFGNQLFKEGKTEEALQKYQSGLNLHNKFFFFFRQGLDLIQLSHHRIYSVS